MKTDDIEFNYKQNKERLERRKEVEESKAFLKKIRKENKDFMSVLKIAFFILCIAEIYLLYILLEYFFTKVL